MQQCPVPTQTGSDGTPSGASSIPSPTAPETFASIGLTGASWAIICSGVRLGLFSDLVLLFLLQTTGFSCICGLFADSYAIASHSDLVMAR